MLILLCITLNNATFSLFYLISSTPSYYSRSDAPPSCESLWLIQLTVTSAGAHLLSTSICRENVRQVDLKVSTTKCSFTPLMHHLSCSHSHSRLHSLQQLRLDHEKSHHMSPDTIISCLIIGHFADSGPSLNWPDSVFDLTINEFSPLVNCHCHHLQNASLILLLLPSHTILHLQPPTTHLINCLLHPPLCQTHLCILYSILSSDHLTSTTTISQCLIASSADLLSTHVYRFHHPASRRGERSSERMDGWTDGWVNG